jgi:hypothetical protein
MAKRRNSLFFHSSIGSAERLRVREPGAKCTHGALVRIPGS